MSRNPFDPGSGRDFSSPQVRIRAHGDFTVYNTRRLRLPNERRPLLPLFKRIFGVLFTLALLAAIGVGVYFAVTELLEDDPLVVQTAEPAPQSTQPAAQSDASAAQTQSGSQSGSQSADSEPATAPAAEEPEPAAADDDSEPNEQSAQPEQQVQTTPAAPISELAPTISEQPVLPAQIAGAEVVAERVTAEPIPSGIPRSFEDGGAYDPSEAATAFTSRWPVGTTLRLTRLPGATLLSDEEQDQVVGTEVLVVVRATETSNTDIQLSPAAFEQIAVYGTERIIAVRVEVTAPPP